MDKGALDLGLGKTYCPSLQLTVVRFSSAARKPETNFSIWLSYRTVWLYVAYAVLNLSLAWFHIATPKSPSGPFTTGGSM